MAEEQELTPEEKLLKVIQKGDAPTLNVGDELSGGATEGDAKDSKSVLKSGDSLIKLSTINTLLVFLALIALGFSGYEVYLNLPQPNKIYSSAEWNQSSANEVLVVASLSDTRDMFTKSRIFGRPPKKIKEDPDKKKSPRKGWRAYARNNLEFKGRSTVIKKQPDGSSKSVLEAIVMDTKLKKMHFLVTGAKIRILDQDIYIDEINGDELVLVCGDERLTIGEPSVK